jgi:hypothetical protein
MRKMLLYYSGDFLAVVKPYDAADHEYSEY